MYTIYRRNEINIEYQILDNDTPYDISNKIVKFVVKNKDDNKLTDEDAVINKVYNLPQDSSTQNGLFTITLTSQDTDIEPSIYDYQIDLYDDRQQHTTTFIQEELCILKSIIKG